MTTAALLGRSEVGKVGEAGMGIGGRSGGGMGREAALGRAGWGGSCAPVRTRQGTWAAGGGAEVSAESW